MIAAGAAAAAAQPDKGKGATKRLDAYLHAHWRELLAILLMAIPAAFLLFHKGSRQAAQTILTLPGMGAASGATPTDTATAASPPTVAIAGVAAAPAAAAAAVGGALQAAVAPAAAAVKQVIAPQSGPTSVQGSTGRAGPVVPAPPVPNFTTSPLFREVVYPSDTIQAAQPATPAKTVLKPTGFPGVSKKVYIPARPATPATPIFKSFNPIRARSSGNQAY